MPLEPQVKVVVDALGASPAGPFVLADMRTGWSLLNAAGLAGAPEVPSSDQVVGGVGVRVYTPVGAPSDGSGPVVVWYHGGGWTLGDLGVSDAACRRLAVAATTRVVSVDYRLAPEHRFPAGVEDALATFEAIAAGGLGAAPSHVIVGGDSAGGNLAAVVSLLARDAGGPRPAAQLLVYPVTDAAMDTDSYRDNAEGYLLTAATMAWFFDQYVDVDLRGDVRVSPLRAASLAGLPPAHVITPGYDPLRDEGRAYADRLRADGVAVTEGRYEGQVHGFFGQPELFGPTAQQAVDEAAAVLREIVSS